MTIYANILAADAHLFPARPNYKSWLAPLWDLFSRINKAMDQAKVERELLALPDYLLRDIGIERHTIGS